MSSARRLAATFLGAALLGGLACVDSGLRCTSAEPDSPVGTLIVELHCGDQLLVESRRVHIYRLDSPKYWRRNLDVPASQPLVQDDMPPGTYEISLFERTGYGRASTSRGPGRGSTINSIVVDVLAGEVTRAVLAVHGGCGLHGVVSVPPELGLERASILFLRREQGSFWFPLGLPPSTTWTVKEPGTLEFDSIYVPPGQYRVVFRPLGAQAVTQDITIAPGETPRVAFSCPRAEASLGISFPADPYTALLPAQMPVLATTWRASSGWQVSRADLGTVEGGVLPGLVADSYLVFFERAGLATFADVGSAPSTPLAFAPPRSLLDVGKAKVRIRLRRGDLGVVRLGLGLVPTHTATEGPRPGVWMYYQRTSTPQNEATFTAVPSGDYEVWAFDRTLGALYDLAETPARFPLHVGETDLDVVLDVDDAHGR